MLVTDDGSLIAHASVVPRTLWHNDHSFSTGYVEGVAVRADQQGRGLGRVIMDHAESIIRERHDIGALNAVDTAAEFYAARDWRQWTGPTAALSSTGLIDTYDEEDRIFVFRPQRQLPTDTWQVNKSAHLRLAPRGSLVGSHHCSPKKPIASHVVSIIGCGTTCLVTKGGTLPESRWCRVSGEVVRQ
ncbi:GNAT family N-acetyltransferase [Williamsia muralis]|uniref:GNAT family N-acetyltransferase n=1 Tax=Williamsia marianensis TaxID=85044 RepID=UPI0016709F55|nr:GNAT family N-acetyltransferase [Williamsia marianensis]